MFHNWKRILHEFAKIIFTISSLEKSKISTFFFQHFQPLPPLEICRKGETMQYPTYDTRKKKMIIFTAPPTPCFHCFHSIRNRSGIDRKAICRARHAHRARCTHHGEEKPDPGTNRKLCLKTATTPFPIVAHPAHPYRVLLNTIKGS